MIPGMGFRPLAFGCRMRHNSLGSMFSAEDR